MNRKGRELLGYATAVLSVVAGAVVVLAPGIGKGAASIPFFVVLLSAWCGGLGPGALSTGLIAVLSIVIPLLRGDGFPPWRVAQTGLFVICGAMITLMVEALHSARQRAEENHRLSEMDRRRLSAVLTSIGDAVIATDTRGRVTFTNPVAGALTGWAENESTDRPIGEVCRIVSEEDGQPIESSVERVLREGLVSALANQTILVARDGTRRPIEDTAAPIWGNGAIEGVVLVFHDVTERRRAEAERERLMTALRVNDKLKDEFLAMLAHELRNPLGVIGNAVKLSTRASSPRDIDWATDVIERQVTHLSRLIDDLLDVSRITQRKINLRPQVVDAAQILDRAMTVVEPLAAEKKHEVRSDYPRGELWLSADPVRLEQVVGNLLANAIKYTEAGGRIHLAAWRDEGNVVIAVRDNGIGLAPELLPRVFDLFTQGDQSLARSEGGLGIGLTVVKTLVELHGGSVTARSEGIGFGSEFLVRFPAVEAPAAATTQNLAATNMGAGAAQLKGARVLIVDDNPDMVQAMARVLGRTGYDVRTALNGHEAIEAARAHAPHFVLLDIGLPEMDGYEVAARLRGETFCARSIIIAVSGYGREEDHLRSRSAGFDHHLVKPVDHDSLMRILSSPGG